MTYSVDHQWEIHLGKGTGKYASMAQLPLANLTGFSNINDYTGQTHEPIIADFDGDGKDDIIQVVWIDQVSKFKVNAYLTRQINENRCHFEKCSIDVAGTSIVNSLFSVADINQDGKMDLVYRAKYYMSFYSGKESNLVVNITDGMGVETEFKYTYFTLDGKSIRNRVSYPVVLRVGQSNGLGNAKNYIDFAYRNPYFNYKRRAFLGFEWFQSKQHAITTEYTFVKKPDYETMVLENISKYNERGILIEQQAVNTEFLSFGNKRYLMYNSLEVSKDFIDNNNRYQYTERYIYTEGAFKGRDSLIISGTKSEDNLNAPYFTKKINRMTYRAFYVNSGKIVQPDSVVSIEKMSGSNLEKIQYVMYTYIPNSALVSTILHKNEHVYGFQRFDKYNAMGIPQEEEERLGFSTKLNKQYVYDSKGRFILQQISQKTDTTKYTYDYKTGNVLSVTDINNLVTRYQYDFLGRKIKTTYPDGTRDSVGINRAIQHKIPNSAYVTRVYSTGKAQLYTFYDKLGRELTHGEYGLSAYVDTRYNNKGEVIKKSYPYSDYSKIDDDDKIWKTYAYDIYGRIISEKGLYIDICYLYGTRRVTTIDRLKNTSYTKMFDIASRLISSTDPGGTINYTYSLHTYNGKVCDRTQISAFGNTTTIITDQAGNRLSLSDPDAGEIVSVYDTDGRMLSQTDANNGSSSYTYDDFGRITKIVTNLSGTTTTTTYTYDLNNRKGTLSSETISPDNTSISYFYDDLMRLSQKRYKDLSSNNEFVYSYSYNNIGLLDTITYPFGFAIKQHYTNRGKLLHISTTENNPVSIYKVENNSVFGPTFFRLGSKIGTYRNYDSHTGLLQSVITGKGSMHRITISITENPNGISLFSGTAPANPPGSETPTSFMLDDTTIQHWNYYYNNVNGIIQERENVLLPYITKPDKEIFTHDKLNRLTQVKRQTYNNNGYTDINTYSISYQQNKVHSKSSLGTFSYNHATKPYALTNIELHNEESISLNRCDLTYTSFNKVKTITEENTDYYYNIKYYPNKEKAITTLKEGDNIISKKYYAGKAFEYDEVTNTKYYYIYAYGQPVAVFIRQGEGDIIPYFIHTDHLGSVDVITDSEGNIVDRMSFDAWGNRRNRLDWTQREEGITHLIDRGFTGHQHLDVFNLINMGGRVYDPVVGQFLSPDPYVQAPDNTQNLNRYAYCLNSPLMYTDPTGEFAVVDSWIVGFIDGFFSKGSNRFKNAWNKANKQAWNDIKIWGGLFASDPNKNFWGRAWETISRFTWQLPQTVAGFTFSQVSNLSLQVDDISYKYGATVLSGNYFRQRGAITLGSFINGSQNLEADPTNTLFQHEYGHYIQSQRLGLVYLGAVGLPSLISAALNDDRKDGSSRHDYLFFEQNANALAFQYFSKHEDNFNWIDNNGTQQSSWNITSNPIYGHSIESALNTHFKTNFLINYTVSIYQLLGRSFAKLFNL